MKLTMEILKVLNERHFIEGQTSICEHSVCAEKGNVLYGLTAEIYCDLVKQAPNKRLSKHYIIVRDWEKDGDFATDWEKPVFYHAEFDDENKNEVFQRAIEAFNSRLDSLIEQYGKVKKIKL